MFLFSFMVSLSCFILIYVLSVKAAVLDFLVGLVYIEVTMQKLCGLYWVLIAAGGQMGMVYRKNSLKRNGKERLLL